MVFSFFSFFFARGGEAVPVLFGGRGLVKKKKSGESENRPLRQNRRSSSDAAHDDDAVFDPHPFARSNKTSPATPPAKKEINETHHAVSRSSKSVGVADADGGSLAGVVVIVITASAASAVASTALSCCFRREIPRRTDVGEPSSGLVLHRRLLEREEAMSRVFLSAQR